MTGLLRLIFGGGLVEQLRLAYQARLAAGNDADKIAADAEIARLERRLATSDNRGLRLAVGIIAMAMALHLAAVVFVSALPFWGWTVHALPPPMDDWQGQIILGFFGLRAIQTILNR
jgi:hypothetical protein